MSKRKERIFMADFETTVYEGQEKTEVWAAALVELYTEDVKIFHSIEDFFSHIVEMKQNIRLYFHNLRFDGSFILSYFMRKYEQAFSEYDEKKLIFEFSPDRKMEKGSFKYTISDRGQWYCMTLRTERGFYVDIRDSLKLLPFSVKQIGKAFKTKHRKLDMEYEGYRYAGCEITPEEQEYIKNDVLVVKEALETLYKVGFDRLTIGSCCLFEYKNKILDPDLFRAMFPNLQKSYKLDADLYGYDTAERYIRRAYRGGWCYVVPEKAGKVLGAGSVFDVNSLYPSMMHSESGNRYPVGYPRFWRGNCIPEKALREKTYYFIRIRTRFYLKPGKLPFIQIKGNLYYKPTENLTTSDYIDSKGVSHRYTILPDGTKKQMRPVITMTCTDYQLFREHYYTEDLEILDGCYFNTEIGIFDEYINKYRKIKQENEGNALRTWAKLALNNLYGKMATNINNSAKIAFLGPDGVVNYLDYPNFTKDPVYIPIGAAITSYARNFTIRAAQRNYHGPKKPGFVYADTDSIHCDLPASKVKGIRIHPQDFCCWKNETNFDYALFIRQKTYLEHVVESDGEPVKKPYHNIKCAGMPENCKKLFDACLLGEYDGDIEKLSDDEKEFLFDEYGRIRKRTLDDFKPGLMVPGKLLPKTIQGGVILVKSFYTLRG